MPQVDLALRAGVGLMIVSCSGKFWGLLMGDLNKERSHPMAKRPDRAQICLWVRSAGLLERTEKGFHFTYDPVYLSRPNAQPGSLTLPLSQKPYESETVFPFFLNLIPPFNVSYLVWPDPVSQLKRHSIQKNPTKRNQSPN